MRVNDCSCCCLQLRRATPLTHTATVGMLQGKDFGKTLRASTELAADVKAPRIMGSERQGHRGFCPAITFAATRSSSSFVRWFKLRVEDVMLKGATVAAVFFC
jgi:hypothetical protein